MVLEAFEHKPVLAENGEIAVELMKKEWPDAILLDLTLGSSTGEEVYEMIRSRFGKIPPTVVLSAVQHAENRARKMPGALFLAKPYTIEELAEILDDAVASARGAA